jgi:hypothetical protein
VNSIPRNVVRVAVSYHEVPTFAQKRKNKARPVGGPAVSSSCRCRMGEAEKAQWAGDRDGGMSEGQWMSNKVAKHGGGTESSVLGSTARHSRFQVGVPTWWAFDQWWELEAQKRA